MPTCIVCLAVALKAFTVKAFTVKAFAAKAFTSFCHAFTLQVSY